MVPPLRALLACLLVGVVAPDSAEKEGGAVMVQTNTPAVTAGPQTPAGKEVKGRIKINGQIFETQCDCAKDAIVEKAAAIKARRDSTIKCQRPQKYQIFYDHHEKAGASTGFHSAQLLQFLGKPSQLKWVNASMRTLSDVDGRIEAHILGVPGGEAGEFINAMQVYEEMLNREMKPGSKETHNVKKFFEAYLAEIAPRKFAMHTSMAALEHLQEELNLGDLDIKNPPETSRDALLGIKCNVHPCGLMAASNVGVAHLQYMLNYPQSYNVQKSLVKEFIREFYSILWDENSVHRKQLEFRVLHKAQQEKAFVTLEVSPGCRDEHKVPLVMPFKKITKGDTVGVTSVFIYHPDAAHIRRKELAQFFMQRDFSHHIMAEDMASRMGEKGKQGLKVTSQYLAAGLPAFRVMVQ